jgi:hypothetical protein
MDPMNGHRANRACRTERVQELVAGLKADGLGFGNLNE